jgi:hypothetical protein
MDLMGDIGMDGRIILKCILRGQAIRTGIVLLRTESNENGDDPSDS